MNGIIKCPRCGKNMMVSKHINEDNTQNVSCLYCGYNTKKQVLEGTTVKAKIDLEKFICSYVKWNNIQDALKDQGLKYCNGEIVEIPQESEDERIQKEILELISISGNGNQFEEIKDWLEKQREKDKLIKELGVYKVKYMQEVLSQQLEKQEHINSPKFKIGDWITNGNAVNHISNIREDGFYCFDYGPSSDMIQYIDNTYHLWTIADAKDGDILAFKDGTSGVLIYKDYINTISGVLSYCRTVRDRFISKEESGWSPTLLFPATKEQRDHLFEKMHEAGYEWDEGVKELGRIEQIDAFESELNALLKKYEYLPKSELAESLEFYLNYIIELDGKFPIKWTQDNIDDLTEFEAEMMHVGESFFGEYAGLNPNDTMSVRVQAKLLLELAPKPKWTEEDEEYTHYLGILVDNTASYEYGKKVKCFLKSLKQRMEGQQ